jgi:uncharacterized protein YgbK (DUF1537 family)
MQRYILCDDLTGAMEVGATLYNVGFAASVTMGNTPSCLPSDTHLVISTESRNCSTRQAKTAITEHIAAMACFGKSWFKKVDSTLRGNIGAEIEVTLLATGIPVALLVPAFPQAGRTTMGGIHYLYGVPVAQTDQGHDPFSPVKHSAIADIMWEQTELKTALISLDIVRTGAVAVIELITQCINQNTAVLIADAVTQADIDTLAQACHVFAGKVLPCGAAAMLYALLGDKPPQEGNRACNGQIQQPMLVISGSPAHATRTQIDYAARHGTAVVPHDTDIPWQHTAQQVAALLKQGKSVILDAARLDKSALAQQFAADSVALTANSHALQHNMAQILGAVLRECHIGGIMVVGGDTLAHIFTAFEVQAMGIAGEAAPLVISGRFVGGKLDGLNLLSKAGGLGAEDAIHKGIEYLTGGKWHG